MTVSPDLPARLEALAVKFERAARKAEAENAEGPSFELTAKALSYVADAQTIREAMEIVKGTADER